MIIISKLTQTGGNNSIPIYATIKNDDFTIVQ